MYARAVPQIPSAAYQDPAKSSPTFQYTYEPPQRVSSAGAWRLEPRDARRTFRSDTVLTPENRRRCRHNGNRNRARPSRYSFAEADAAAPAAALSGGASAQYFVANVSAAAAERQSEDFRRRIWKWRRRNPDPHFVNLCNKPRPASPYRDSAGRLFSWIATDIDRM